MGPFHWEELPRVAIPPNQVHSTGERGQRHEGLRGRRTCNLCEVSLHRSCLIITCLSNAEPRG
jgi:hypothetical protein